MEHGGNVVSCALVDEDVVGVFVGDGSHGPVVVSVIGHSDIERLDNSRYMSLPYNGVCFWILEL